MLIPEGVLLQKAKEDEGGDSTALGVTSGGKPGQSLAAIAKQTTQLQDTLANLKLEETLGSELIKRYYFHSADCFLPFFCSIEFTVDQKYEILN